MPDHLATDAGEGQAGPPADQTDPQEEQAGLRAELTEQLDRAVELHTYDDQDTTRELVERVLQRLGDLPWIDLQVRAHALASTVAVNVDDDAAAAEHADRAMTWSRRGGPVDLALAKFATGRAMAARLELAPALGLLQEALVGLESSADRIFRVRCEVTIARVLARAGQYEVAMHWRRSAAGVALQAGLPHWNARCMVDAVGPWPEIGERYRAFGDEASAVRAWEQGVVEHDEIADLIEQHGQDLDRLVLHCNRSYCLLRLGRLEEALTGFEAALALRPERFGAELTAEVQLSVGHAWLAVGELDRAEQALAAAREPVLDRPQELSAWLSIRRLEADVARARGDLPSALVALRLALSVADRAALEQTATVGRGLAARREAEQVQARAKAERERAEQLAEVHDDLRARAEELDRQASLDPLTGLANRRTLDAQLAQAHQRAVTRQMPVCVALLDLDHFKQINDRYSHAVGDLVLQRFAALVAEQVGDQVGEQGLPARYGGEEFVILFEATGLGRAAAVCEQVRAGVAAFDWSSVAGGLQVTVSIGVTDLAEDPDPVTGLARADAHLYAAKRGGRNRVIAS